MALLCTSLKAEMSACMEDSWEGEYWESCPSCVGGIKIIVNSVKVVVLAKFRPQAAARLQKQPVQRDDGCLFWHYFR